MDVTPDPQYLLIRRKGGSFGFCFFTPELEIYIYIYDKKNEPRQKERQARRQNARKRIMN